MKKVAFGILLSLLLPLGLAAQSSVVTMPYLMSFEKNDPVDAAELQNWVFNPGMPAGCQDKWVCGRQLHSDGQYGVYISYVDSMESGHGNQKCVQFLYRDFQLPDGAYYVSFDYLFPEDMFALPNTHLYAGCFAHVGSTPKTDAMSCINNPFNAAALPSALGVPSVTTDSRQDYPMDLPHNVRWQNARVLLPNYKNPTNGQVRELRVWFAWVGNPIDTLAGGIAAAIDNIQITSGNCASPHDLTIDIPSCEAIQFAWEGSSARYQAQYRRQGSNFWSTRSGSTTSVNFTNMREGNYDFRVRGICYEEDTVTGQIDTLYSPYTYLSNVNVFCPDQHCINYVALTDTNVATCTYGHGGSDYSTGWQGAFENVGVIDYGSESKLSRHTVNWDTTATDPNTLNQLRLIPQGQYASVRLGNWDSNNEAEAITYDFYVDPDQSILLVRYAIVLESPGHDDENQPRFVIDIVDENDERIDATCGVVDLNPNNPVGWNTVTVPGASESYVWKDWTTLGLNLDPYKGQHLKVRLATYDCFYTMHMGYAYFTMDCASAELKNSSCKAGSNTAHFEAPEGFLYEWMPTGTTNVQGTERTMDISLMPGVATDWTCRLTSTENPDCFFDLSINTLPRLPIPTFNAIYAPEDCSNRYVFRNHSFVRVNDHGSVIDDYDQGCDSYFWDFGFDGEQSDMADSVIVEYPQNGGTYQVTLTAIVGDGEDACMRDTVVTLVVPAIGEVSRSKDTTICEGSYVIFHDEMVFEENTYIFGGPDEKTGCLTMDTLHLHIAHASEPAVDSLQICYGESIVLPTGDVINTKVTKDTVYKFVNMMGCDSVVVYHVYVSPQFLPEFTTQEVDESHESASITVSGTGYAGFIFEGKRYEGPQVLDDLDGGLYDFLFFNADSCWLDTTVMLGNGCLRNMVYQRWNDVLSLRNSSLIGGLEFDSFQWTFEGVDIPGATDSYYYAHDGLQNGVYTCRVRVVGSVEYAETCSFRPNLKQVQNAPEVRKVVRDNMLYIVRDGVTYTIYGDKVK